MHNVDYDVFSCNVLHSLVLDVTLCWLHNTKKDCFDVSLKNSISTSFLRDESTIFWRRLIKTTAHRLTKQATTYHLPNNPPTHRPLTHQFTLK